MTAPLRAADVIADVLLACDGEPRDAAGREGYRNITSLILKDLFAACGDPDRIVLERGDDGATLAVAVADAERGRNESTCQSWLSEIGQTMRSETVTRKPLYRITPIPSDEGATE